MGPKIQGAINFLTAAASDSARVIIGPLERPVDALAGRTGTEIAKA
jgi:carbamate kinase